MKHILFPTVSAADAFIADLQSRGVVQPQVGTMNMSRRVQQAAGDTMSTGTTTGTVTTPPPPRRPPTPPATLTAATWTAAAPLKTPVRALSRAPLRAP
ncbi:hypothetical protein MSS93_03410 [Deinococcus radiodurans]|nr:hypothetical protein MSS93_03410 [Deinococcus radiodurans]